MTEIEKEFYEKEFNFSYSSLNKLLFSPKLFYKEYILKDKEHKLDSHLIEGKLLHCLLFERENLHKKFKVVPSKAPSDNLKKVFFKLYDKLKAIDKADLELLSDQIKPYILQTLSEENLYQSLKEDDSRLAKVQLKEFVEYWNFIANTRVDVIDEKMLEKAEQRLEIIKENEQVKKILDVKGSDFDLDPVQTFSELYLKSPLNNFKFGLHGYIDHMIIDSNKKVVNIYDFKTTGKSLSDFAETVDFYNYWMQAAVYTVLVLNYLKDNNMTDYNIKFNFIVIDNYDQVYSFEVQEKTLGNWLNELREILNVANYHYLNNNYQLPYQFLKEQVVL